MPIAIPGVPSFQIKLGKRKERSQMCELLTDDGRWIDIELPALYSCMADESLHSTYLIDADNQFLAEDNNWHQLLTEKSQVPLCLRKESIYQDGVDDITELNNLANDLFRLTSKKKQSEQFIQMNKDATWNKILWLVTIICSTMIVIAGAQMLWGPK